MIMRLKRFVRRKQTSNKQKDTSDPKKSSDPNLIPLTQLRRGQHGIVKEMHGGDQFVQKLASLGIRPNKRLTKVSTMVFSGPVVVSINNRQVALGSGMARRIIVEIK